MKVNLFGCLCYYCSWKSSGWGQVIAQIYNLPVVYCYAHAGCEQRAVELATWYTRRMRNAQFSSCLWTTLRHFVHYELSPLQMANRGYSGFRQIYVRARRKHIGTNEVYRHTCSCSGCWDKLSGVFQLRKRQELEVFNIYSHMGYLFHDIRIFHF